MDKEEKLEQRKKKIWNGFLVACGAVLLTSVGCLGYSVYREKKLSRALQNAIKSVSEMTEVSVSEGIVNRGITEAIERECGKVAQRAVDGVSKEIAAEAQKKVAAAVEQQYARIKEGVADAFAKEVAKVDKDDIMADITEKAKELLISKFDGKLDSLLSDYNRNLENVGKIYSSIADSMAGKKSVSLVS